MQSSIKHCHLIKQIAGVSLSGVLDFFQFDKGHGDGWLIWQMCVLVGKKVPGIVTKGEFTVGLCSYIMPCTNDTILTTNFCTITAVAREKLVR